MERSLNQKYANLNFLPERMVVSSLLFAKNAPFMIRDAVKYLISKDASALVIKALLYQNLNIGEKKARIHRIFPIFYDQYAIARFDTEHSTVTEDYPSQASAALKISRRTALPKVSCAMTRAFSCSFPGHRSRRMS